MTTTGESHPAEQEPKPINWRAWLSVPQVELWQGVALVNGIDPYSLHRSGKRRIWTDRKSIFESASFSSASRCAAFHEAMGWAERAANCGGPIHLRAQPITRVVRHDVTVSLAEVVAYFAGMGWPGIPAPLLGELKAVAAVSEPMARASQSAMKIAREDGRLKSCEDEGIVFDKISLQRLPDGIGAVAIKLGISRQSMATDLRRAIERRFASKREGKA